MQTLIKRNYSYYLLLPGFLLFFILFVLPSLGSFYYAFTNWSGIGHYSWIGMENFGNLLDTDNNSISFKNTFIFATITTILKVSLGFALALFVNQKLKSAVYLRSILFFPVVLSSIAVALAFQAIMHPVNGVLNIFLRFIQLDGLAQDWLTNPSIVMYSISFVEVWKYVGFHMVLFLAGLQTVPKEMYESSTIDGANKWQQFRFITFPLLRPVLNVNIIFSIIGGLKVFDIVYGLTSGGPGNASNVINIIIYKNFAEGRYGEATAANVVLFLMILIIILISNKFLGQRGGDES